MTNFKSKMAYKLLKSSFWMKKDEEYYDEASFSNAKMMISKIAIHQLILNDPDKLLEYLLEKKYSDDKFEKFIFEETKNLIEDDKFILKKLISVIEPYQIVEFVDTYALAEIKDKLLSSLNTKEKQISFMISVVNSEKKVYENYPKPVPTYEIKSIIYDKLIDEIKNNKVSFNDFSKLYKKNDLFSLDFVKVINMLLTSKEEQKTYMKYCCEYLTNAYIEKSEYNKILGILFKRIDKDMINFDTFKKFFEPDYININAIASYIKCNSFAMKNLKFKEMDHINIKLLNQLLSMAKEKFPDMEKPSELHRDLPETAILNMMISIGYQKTKELLEGKYGQLTAPIIGDIFGNLSILDYKKENKTVVYNDSQETLINFLFGSGINEQNSNIKKIISGEVEVSLKRIIHDWDDFYSKIGKNISLNDIIKFTDDITEDLTPDLKEVKPILLLEDESSSKIIIETYKKMLKKTESIIPKVKGVISGYEYEILDMNDVNQMRVGYDTNCCFTFDGASSDALMHALIEKDSRILVVRKDGKLIAQSWLWREGNVVCFDDIETEGVTRSFDDNILNACKEAANKIIEISKASESIDEQVEICTVGVNPNIGFLSLKKQEESLERLSNEEILYPKDIYTDASEQQFILAQSESYQHSRSFDPSVVYQDERSKVIFADPQQTMGNEMDELEEKILVIDCRTDSENISNINDYTFLAVGQDWYIGIDENGEIIKKCSGTDNRIKEEMAETLNIIKEKIKTGELNSFLNDTQIEQTSIDKIV